MTMYKEHTRISLVDGGNVFKQGDHVTLGFTPRDYAGNVMDLTGKDIAGVIYSHRKGIMYEAPATFDSAEQKVSFTIDGPVDYGQFQIEFTVTDASDPDYRLKLPSAEQDGRLTIKPSVDNMDFVGVQMTTVTQLQNELQVMQTEFEGEVLPRVQSVEGRQTEVEGKQVELEATVQTGIAAFTEDTEVALARGGEVNLGARLDKTAAQLAETGSRIDNIIVTPAEGITEQEIIDARAGAASLGSRLTTLSKQANGFPIILRELPGGVKDTFVKNSDGTYTLTQNIKETTIKDADVYGLVTSPVNVDFVRIWKPTDYIKNNVGGNIDGTLRLEGTLGDKPYADNAANINYISSVSNLYYAPIVAKGTYADLTAAKAALVGKKLTYQLTTPIQHIITSEVGTNGFQIARLTSQFDAFSLAAATKPWAGKKANFLGDSITQGSYGNYVTKVKDALGLAVANNYGIGGSRLCVTGDPAIDDAYTPLIRRYQNIDMTADIIFVLIGTNDYSSQVPLGSTTSTLETEFNGALNIMMDWFRTNFPDKLVVFSTILHRYNDAQHPITANMYRSAIKERCEAKQFVLYDAYKNTGFDFVKGYYDKVLTPDGLHPNAKGAEILGRKIAGFLSIQ